MSFLQILIQHHKTSRDEIQAQHEAAQVELGIQLEKEAQLEVEEYVYSTETNKEKILQEKQSKLNVFIDADALNDEHKEQVFD